MNHIAINAGGTATLTPTGTAKIATVTVNIPTPNSGLDFILAHCNLLYSCFKDHSKIFMRANLDHSNLNASTNESLKFPFNKEKISS